MQLGKMEDEQVKVLKVNPEARIGVYTEGIQYKFLLSDSHYHKITEKVLRWFKGTPVYEQEFPKHGGSLEPSLDTEDEWVMGDSPVAGQPDVPAPSTPIETVGGNTYDPKKKGKDEKKDVDVSKG